MHQKKKYESISLHDKENKAEEEELEERGLVKEEAYELPAYIGVPFGPDGEPIGID